MLQASSGGFTAIFSSDQRASGSTHDFQIQFNPTLDLSSADRYEVAVQSINTWYSHYNISDDYNNRTLKYSSNGGVSYTTITIPAGNYSALDLISEISSLITASGGVSANVIILANFNTQKFEFVLANNYRLNFDTGNLYVIMGVDPIVYSASFTAPNVAKLSNNVNNWLVHFSMIQAGILGGSSSRVIYSLVPDTEPGGHIYEKPSFPCYCLVEDAKHFTHVRIQITDQNQRPINLNGEPFSMALHFRPVYKLPS